MHLGKVIFGNGVYHTREAYHNATGCLVTFGTESLNNALMTEDGEYISKAAQVLDERIYAYVEDDVLTSYSDKEFEEYVNKYYD